MPSSPRPAVFPIPHSVHLGLARLGDRIADLEKLDITVIQSAEQADDIAVVLGAAVDDTLVRTFGVDTVEYERYRPATQFSYPIRRGGTSLSDVQAGMSRCKRRAVDLLRQAKASLDDHLLELETTASVMQHSKMQVPAQKAASDRRRVFLVHGHSGGPRESVARFLEKAGLEPIILHEQANQGRTIIEKFEAHADVGFAVILLTPDDFGAALGQAEHPRARQNVILELGYFIGRLGRAHVCALKAGDLELPTDILGIVWVPLDEGGGWKLALARELKTAGYSIDLNVVMA